jgi:hypothetical protein
MAAQPTALMIELLVIFGMDSKMPKPADFYEALVRYLRGDHAGLEAWQRKMEARGQSTSLEPVMSSSLGTPRAC